MNILMTGITGYLGSAIAHRLVNQSGIRLFGLKRSSSDTSRIKKIINKIECFNIDKMPLCAAFEKVQVNIVLHCATNYGRNHGRRSDMVETNLILPLRLLEASIEHKVSAFINTDTMLDKGISDYSLSKRQFNDWLQIYGAEILAVNVALEHFFGPGDDPSKFVSFVIREMLENVPRILLTTGVQKRDFVHIEDVVTAFDCIIKHACRQGSRNKGYEAFEIGRGESISIKEFVLMIREITGNVTTSLEFGALPSRKNEIMCIMADISKIKRLGWTPSLSLFDALRLTIEEEKNRLC